MSLNHSDKTEKDQSGKKRHKKRRTVVLVVVGILVIALAWLGITQRNNLKALYLAMTTDAETLQLEKEKQDKKQEEILQQYGLTKPDVSQIEGGDSETTPSSVPESPEPGESPSSGETGTSPQPSAKPDQSEEQMTAKLQEYINQLYRTEAAYRATLNGIVEGAKQEFLALPRDQRNKENKMKIVRSKLDVLLAQEDACDAEVEAILSGMQAVLKEYGQSNDLVNEVRSYYQESKVTWKAAMMTQLYS